MQIHEVIIDIFDPYNNDIQRISVNEKLNNKENNKENKNEPLGKNR